jgi:hypothetical protein
MNIAKPNMNTLPQYNIRSQVKSRPSADKPPIIPDIHTNLNAEIQTFRVKGVNIPVEENAINNLDLKLCRRYRNIIVTRCNYIIDLKKYADITTFEYQTEKHTLDILLQKYEPVIRSLEFKEKHEQKRRQKLEAEQAFQNAKAQFARTKICKWCFNYREKIDWCLYQCKVCGRKDDTSKDSGYM